MQLHNDNDAERKGKRGDMSVIGSFGQNMILTNSKRKKKRKKVPG